MVIAVQAHSRGLSLGWGIGVGAIAFVVLEVLGDFVSRRGGWRAWIGWRLRRPALPRHPEEWPAWRHRLSRWQAQRPGRQW